MGVFDAGLAAVTAFAFIGGFGLLIAVLVALGIFFGGGVALLATASRSALGR